MKIHHCEQGDAEWHNLRAQNFTASEIGAYALEPVKITLTVDEIKAFIDEVGVSRKGLSKRDDLLSALRDRSFEFEPELCEGALTAILGKLKQERVLSMQSRVALTLEESIYAEREAELAAKSERTFEHNIPVKYGKLLEPHAREYYRQATGYDVEEVGFIEHDSGGFGCSPDGLAFNGRASDALIDLNPDGTIKIQYISHGIEIKCPLPETHLAWLLAGTLPECHKLQVHMGMAVTGLDRWEFLSYCPGDAPLLVTVERDETTEKLEAGLKILVQEKAKIKARLAMLWRNAYNQ